MTSDLPYVANDMQNAENMVPLVQSARCMLDFNIIDVRIPKIGMEFESEDAAYKFYNDFSLREGFSVRKGWLYRKDGEVQTRCFFCSKEGQRVEDKRFVRKHRAEVRTNCLAKMIVKLIGDKYQVTDFESNHNHILQQSPTKVQFLRSHRHVSKAQAILADSAANVGITPKESTALQANHVGGQQNLGFIPLDLKNYLRTKRQKAMEKGEVAALLEYFKRKQKENPSFFYSMQLDEDNQITNIFWVDARMIVDYEHFGDAVSFDTTYRTNNISRPCALFVGVNHHRQNILFGAALLYDETADSFIWLFETFLIAMSNKKPITIFTDQCAAMAKAIQIVMPETNHRLCVWHIYKNAGKHLSHVFNAIKSFAGDLEQCMLEFETPEEFLEGWDMMLQKYGLQENLWLKQLFIERERWSMAYGRHMFCAGMKTTQRSESMNIILRRYVSSRINPVEFLHHFDRVVEDRRFEESQVDFKMVDRTPILPIFSKMLAQVAKVYTPSVLEFFHREYQDHLDCEVHGCMEKGTIMEFKVAAKKSEHNVTFDSIDQTIVCSCKKFEFAGILCSHALKVLDIRCVKVLPVRYIMKRWTRHAKVWTTRDNYNSKIDVDPNKAMGTRFMELSRILIGIATRGSESERAYKAAIDQAKIMSRVVDEELTKTSEDEHQPVSSNVYASQLKSSNAEIECIGSVNEVNLELTTSGIKKRERPARGGKSNARKRSCLEKPRRRRMTKSLSAQSSLATSSQPLQFQFTSPNPLVQPPQEHFGFGGNLSGDQSFSNLLEQMSVPSTMEHQLSHHNRDNSKILSEGN